VYILGANIMVVQETLAVAGLSSSDGIPTTASAPTSAEPTSTLARSPFAILTGLIDCPIPGDDGWALELR